MRERQWEGGYLKDEGRKRVTQVIHSGFCITALEKSLGLRLCLLPLLASREHETEACPNPLLNSSPD